MGVADGLLVEEKEFSEVIEREMALDAVAAVVDDAGGQRLLVSSGARKMARRTSATDESDRQGAIDDEGTYCLWNTFSSIVPCGDQREMSASTSAKAATGETYRRDESIDEAWKRRDEARSHQRRTEVVGS